MDKSSEFDILQEGKDNYRRGKSAWQENYDRYDLCMRMLDGDQWEEKTIKDRGESRPHIVVNLLEQHVQQVVNQNRQNRPGGKVSPVDGQADPDTAEIEEGLIRHTEYIANADWAYDTAVENAAGGGIGFIGLTIDYIGPDSFDQELRVRRFPDSKCVIIDPNSQEPDGGDMNWAHVRQRISKSDYERKYGKSTLTDKEYRGTEDDADWIDSDGLWLSEYWVRTWEKRSLLKLSLPDGSTSTGFSDDPQTMMALQFGAYQMAERKVDFPRVTQYVMTCDEVLDTTEWPGSRIPIVPVYGNMRYVEGKRKLKALIFDSLDSQRGVNFCESLDFEAMAMAPKPKFIMAEGQDEGHEDEWANANTSTDARLIYKPISLGSVQVGEPQYRVFEISSPTIANGAIRHQNYIKATTGQFDPSLGNVDPQNRSGKAIQALQNQGANATSHFADNLTRAMKALYKMMIELFPKVVGPDQATRIIGADQSQKIVNLAQFKGKDGTQRSIDMATGRYDVTVSVGPSQDSQRDAAQEVLAQVVTLPIIGQNPQLGPKFIALQIRQANLGPIGDQMAELLDPPPPTGQQPLPPEVQQALQQGQQAAQENQQLQHIIQTKQVEKQAEFQMKQQELDKQIRIAEIGQQTALIVAEGKENVQLAMADTQAQLAYLKTQLEGIHAERLQDKKHAHDAGMAAVGHVHAVTQAAHQHTQQQELAAQNQQAAMDAQQQQPQEQAAE